MTTPLELRRRAARPRLDEARAVIAAAPRSAAPSQGLLEQAVARGLMRPSQIASIAFASLEDCEKCDGSGRAGYDFGLCSVCGGCGIEFGSRNEPVDLATFLALCAAPAEIAAAEAAAIELYLRYVGAAPRFVRWFGSTAEHGYRLATQYRIPAWPRAVDEPPFNRWTALSTDFADALLALETGAARRAQSAHSEALSTLARSGLWIVSIESGLVLFVPTDGLH
ncbi:MAG: hypothetical protein JNK05_16345 [Myxococcales bacterium]|nr:hypothetical protein [Myxococcales bacterium]